MFGQESSITEYFPRYFLDYRENISDISGQRWSHRITSQDGNWSGNLYDFYFKVIGRVVSDIDIPFHLEGNEYIRQSETRVHKALREAVLNNIIHANYSGDTGIVIEKKKNYFRFSNPGILRMPLEKAVAGGNSGPRNPVLFKMFAQIGLGERSGYGLESIHTTWKQQHWKRPALIEEFQPERTILTLLPTSLMPIEIVSYIKHVLKDRYHLLSPDEVLILVTAHQEKSVSNVRMQELTNNYPREISKVLSDLVEEGLLIPQGTGRGTSYVLSDVFAPYDENYLGNIQNTIEGNEENNGNKENILGNSENLLGNNAKSLGNNKGYLEKNESNSGNNEENKGDNEHNNKDLIEIARPAREKKRLKPEILRSLILLLCSDRFLTVAELSYYLKRDQDGLRKNHIKELVDINKLELRYPNTPNHRHQAYKTVKENS